MIDMDKRGPFLVMAVNDTYTGFFKFVEDFMKAKFTVTVDEELLRKAK
jgi:hypothetical protein